MCQPRTPLAADYGPQDRSLRAADHDRDAVTDILREQHLAGRLDTDELQERIDGCYAAKTYADLDAVLADLPAEVPGQTVRTGSDTHVYRGGWRGPLAWLPLPVVIPILLAAAAISHGFLLWLVIPFVLFFVSRRWRWRSTF
ncbi:MAG TPA: DUF1707 domain-containing protein [Solirubrobacteraceae bacterium]|nr:DUF1707 domain-containing protein [Solirubrobacteraceae bacterium]